MGVHTHTLRGQSARNGNRLTDGGKTRLKIIVMRVLLCVQFLRWWAVHVVWSWSHIIDEYVVSQTLSLEKKKEKKVGWKKEKRVQQDKSPPYPRCSISGSMNPFRTTAAPFRGQTTRNLYGLAPQRDCGPKRVNAPEGVHLIMILRGTIVNRTNGIHKNR